MLLRKEDFDKHLIWCKTKQSKKTPQSEARPDSAETSRKPWAEPHTDLAELCPASTEPCQPAEPYPTSQELCPPLSKPCSSGAKPADSEVLARPKGGRVRPVVRSRCPMCGVLMNKRNIGKHIIRKHANLELFDVNATYQCIDTDSSDFAAQETAHEHSGKKKARRENQSSQSQDSHLNADLILRTSMSSYKCLQLRSVSHSPTIVGLLSLLKHSMKPFAFYWYEE